MVTAHPSEAPTSTEGKGFQCFLITPQGKILDDRVTFVSAPGAMGSFGVLAGHAPMVAVLKNGILKIQKDQEVQLYSIDSGVLEVRTLDHAVLILVDQAVKTTEHQVMSHQIGIKN